MVKQNKEEDHQMTGEKTELNLTSDSLINDVLGSVDREREREIISRRFGLFDRKETLEQIGEMLGITRERVRQLEKAVLIKLQGLAEQGKIKQVVTFQDKVLEELAKVGGVAKVSDLTASLVKDPSRIDQSRVAFLGQLSPKLLLVPEDDFYFQSLVDSSNLDLKKIKSMTTNILTSIKKFNQPKPIKDIAKDAGISDLKLASSLASTSKELATLNGLWGLLKWPTVNPKNIRDKIYVILKENGHHMHFNEIAEAIRASDFKRKDVTTQAIHNELIKDKRFVLIGRGIYALKEWGYSKGTVADIIAEILKEASTPLHRDEIVKRVLKSRFVKETTILLNLQGKPQFKRVAKATYELAE